MSKMFDYVSGKRGGKIAELEATIEHLMAHCVPASALDEQRTAVIEECATAVKDYGEENILSYGMDGLLAAIRALKDKP